MRLFWSFLVTVALFGVIWAALTWSLVGSALVFLIGFGITWLAAYLCVEFPDHHRR